MATTRVRPFFRKRYHSSHMIQSLHKKKKDGSVSAFNGNLLPQNIDQV